MNRRRTHSASRVHPSAFTLVELLVVIGIIALLAGILFPTIRKMRIASQEADTRNLLNQIDQACQAYYLVERAYPGPLSDSQLVPPTGSIVNQDPFYAARLSGTTLVDVTEINANTQQITGSENLLLGLMGGLELNRSGAGPAVYLSIDANKSPDTIGSGPASLNSLKIGRTNAYIETNSRSNGRLRDAYDEPMNDTIIPEFVDRFTGAGEVQDVNDLMTADQRLRPYRIGGMPILYLRSHRTGNSSLSFGSQSPATPAQSIAVTDPRAIAVDYQIQEIMPYTNSAVGSGRPSESEQRAKFKSPNLSFDIKFPHGLRSADPTLTMTKVPSNSGVRYQYPYDAYDYLVEPGSYDSSFKGTLSAAQVAAKRARKKDSYVLISAGRDRIYGTEDDIVNFGSVLP